MARTSKPKAKPKKSSGSKDQVFRYQAAVEGSRTASMMVDRDLIITSANPATVELVTKNLAEFTSQYPGFSLETLIGTCIDIFHKNPEHQRRILANPTNLPHRAQIKVGRCLFDLNITAIVDNKGNYVGNNLEWSDVTHLKSVREYKSGSITVTDPNVRKRLTFLGVKEEHLGIVATYAEIVSARLDELIDDFYKYIFANPETAQIIEKHTTVEKQRPGVKRYLLTLFSGTIDDAYVDFRVKVGGIHDDIDLDSNWYIAMYTLVRDGVVKFVRESGASQAEIDDFSNAINVIIQADIAMCITALTDSRRKKVEALKDDVQAKMDEAAEFIKALSALLGKMSQYDLSSRLEGNFAGGYATSQEQLNLALDNLDTTLQQVAVGAGQVAAASNQISAGSQELARGSSEQASSVEEISASLSEVNTITKQNTESAKESKKLADEAQVAAEKGTKSMTRLSDAVSKIKTSSDETAKIIKTIDEIAFQTNLLALNAAVEAARAGDAGKGFAVVAEEVRNLAMRSAEAAKNTANMIEESVKNADSGVTINEEVMQNFEEINKHIQNIGTVMAEIAAASEQQSQGIDQINTGVEQVNQITQKNAANSEESASAAEELTSQSEDLRAMINKFKLTNNATAEPVNRIAAAVATPTPGNGQQTAAPVMAQPVPVAQPTPAAKPAPMKNFKSEIPLDNEEGKPVLNEF